MFESLNVIDCSTVLAGPSVGTFFAELGARVIKIENPEIPDVTRSWKLPDENLDSTVSAYFSSVNYRKNFRQLNFKNADDLSKLADHIIQADIFLSNFKKGDDLKFGITDSWLHELNPQLIIGKISGFGSDSDRVAYDLILQAETGFMSMNGTPESGPVKMPVALIDVLAAHQLKEGILCALLERTQTNRGKVVSVSLYDAAVCSLTNQASNFLMENHIPKRIGSLHPNIAPYGELFTTADKHLITFAIGSQRHFELLCSLLNLTELPADKRFSQNTARVSNRTVLAQLIQAQMDQLTFAVIQRYCLDHHLPMGEVKSLDRVFESKQAQNLIREEEIDGSSTKRISQIAFRS